VDRLAESGRDGSECGGRRAAPWEKCPLSNPAWQTRIGPVVAALVAPLEADGGTFEIAMNELPARKVVVHARIAECADACSMSYEALERLLAEAVRRIDPSVELSLSRPEDHRG